jgi:hypothetical protein
VKLLRKTLFLLAFSALSGAAWVAHRPAAWGELQALDPAKPAPLRVLDQLEQAAIKRSAPLEISEARVNEHLRTVLRPVVVWEKAAPWLRLTSPQIDLQENRATLRLRWHLGDYHVCDLTVNLAVERQADQFRVEVLDGAYGRLQVPRGLLHPAKAVLAELARVLQPEIKALFDMNQVQIAENKLVLDPRIADIAANP